MKKKKYLRKLLHPHPNFIPTVVSYQQHKKNIFLLFFFLPYWNIIDAAICFLFSLAKKKILCTVWVRGVIVCFYISLNWYSYFGILPFIIRHHHYKKNCVYFSPHLPPFEHRSTTRQQFSSTTTFFFEAYQKLIALRYTQQKIINWNKLHDGTRLTMQTTLWQKCQIEREQFCSNKKKMKLFRPCPNPLFRCTHIRSLFNGELILFIQSIEFGDVFFFFLKKKKKFQFCAFSHVSKLNSNV